MKAVIFAAGKSTRTYPLTLTRPKPLLPVANKPILAHQLDALREIVDGVRAPLRPLVPMSSPNSRQGKVDALTDYPAVSVLYIALHHIVRCRFSSQP